MQTILVAGAGKSSIYLIQYLLSHAGKENWRIIVADGSRQAIEEKTLGNPYAEVAVIDITNDRERKSLVGRADIVVSLMPPTLHIYLAKDCLDLGKNLITSSYISDEMRAMDLAAKAKGLMFMCEMGLDPGIDHMTASQIFHGVQKVQGQITSFKSYCGGLIAPESDDNPWHYKFSWNPRNIVTAGFGGAKYLLDELEVYIPYKDLFNNNDIIKVDAVGSLAYYANRDSLRYLEIFDTPGIRTFLRATLRHPDFCKGWKAIIDLGLTNEQDQIPATTTFAGWMALKTGYTGGDSSLMQHIARTLQIDNDSTVMNMLSWLGLFEHKVIPENSPNSASILLHLLLEKWDMKPTDKDMVVMQHEVSYTRLDKTYSLVSSMVLKGENREYSAMAKTVGLPMGILARLVLKHKLIPPAGVLVPIMPEVYKPVLKDLEHHGIVFHERIA